METTDLFIRTRWIVDFAHSQIGFKVRYLRYSALRGNFKEYNACIHITGDDFKTVEADFWINPSSLNTGQDERDRHLTSKECLDVEQFSVINFTFHQYLPAPGNSFNEISGELTVKGIKQRIRLNVEFGGIIKNPHTCDKAVFSLSGQASRKVWGLYWNDNLLKNGDCVSDEIWINCDLQLIKQS